MKTEERKPLWEVFSELVNMVRHDYRQKGVIGGGHDFLHSFMVAQYAERIAEEKDAGRLAWVAGIIHDTNRLFPEKNEEQLQEQIRFYLQHTPFSPDEKELIVEAVTNHDEPNRPEDKSVTVILKDADRLANIGPNIIIRAGQFYHNLPAYNPRWVVIPDPMATYRNPKTVLQDIRFCLDWEDWFRLPKAKELSRPYFDLLRQFIAGFESQLREVNLLPYPFEKDFEGS